MLEPIWRNGWKPNLTGDLADSTEKMYKGAWAKWQAWARRHAWESDLLSPTRSKLENEDRLLGFLAYVGWIGGSAATVKQALFAVKAMHKRLGAGDPTEGMHRIWILANAMERKSDKKPRRLGVTPNMMKWLHGQLDEKAQVGEFKIDCVMLRAAVTLAWFFMLRAKEYADFRRRWHGHDRARVRYQAEQGRWGDQGWRGGERADVAVQEDKGWPAIRSVSRKQWWQPEFQDFARWNQWSSSGVLSPTGLEIKLKHYNLCSGGQKGRRWSDWRSRRYSRRLQWHRTCLQAVHVALVEDWRRVSTISSHRWNWNREESREMVELYGATLLVGRRKDEGV